MTQLSPVKTSQFKMKPDSENESWLVFDLESDGLYDNVTVIHCIVIHDIQTNQTHKYGPTDITAALKHLATAHVLIGQNILFYDIPVIQKLFPDTHTGGRDPVFSLLRHAADKSAFAIRYRGIGAHDQRQEKAS